MIAARQRLFQQAARLCRVGGHAAPVLVSFAKRKQGARVFFLHGGAQQPDAAGRISFRSVTRYLHLAKLRLRLRKAPVGQGGPVLLRRRVVAALVGAVGRIKVRAARQQAEEDRKPEPHHTARSAAPAWDAAWTAPAGMGRIISA
jgi:hypothetical protein